MISRIANMAEALMRIARKVNMYERNDKHG